MDIGVDFAQIEREFVRERIYSEFAWRAFDVFSPLNRMTVPLSEAKIAFVTTAGVHLEGDQPFDTDAKEGDPSFREFRSATTFEYLRLSHSGYNTKRAILDLNVVLPLDHLRQAVRDGRIGQLTPTIYSFMGYVAETDHLISTTAPAVAEHLKAEGADLVLLAPT